MQVELISHFGNDNVICDVARVSYNKHASNYSEEQNAKLINYLVNHKHTSPFRHPQVQFRITCPIYVERQLFKHQVGISVNSISGRYVDFSDSYTKIKQFRLQSKSSKQGSGEDLNGADNLHALQIQNKVIEWCSKAYQDLIDLGISKEQARTILPLNLNTTFIWTGSLLALFHLFNLRLKSDTQQETREVAMQMLEQLKSIEGNPFKESLKAFGL
jgi:thymidylate synthase (FAD)